MWETRSSRLIPKLNLLHRGIPHDHQREVPKLVVKVEAGHPLMDMLPLRVTAAEMLAAMVEINRHLAETLGLEGIRVIPIPPIALMRMPTLYLISLPSWEGVSPTGIGPRTRDTIGVWHG